MSRMWIGAVLVLIALALGCEDGGECPLDCDGIPVIFPGVEVVTDSTAVTMGFSVDARGCETFCECEYSGSPGVWLVSDSVLAGADWGPRHLILCVRHLEPETRYLYRLRAISCAGFASTSVDSFQTLRRNLFPDTFVSGLPPESIPGGGYKIHVFWFGVDPDGTIDHFEWTTSDREPPLAWRSTMRTDSTFALGAGFSGEWGFAVRAVDNEGGIDRSPAIHIVSVGMFASLGL